MQLRAGDALQQEIPAKERKTGQSGRSRLTRESQKAQDEQTAGIPENNCFWKGSTYSYHRERGDSEQDHHHCSSRKEEKKIISDLAQNSRAAYIYISVCSKEEVEE